MKTYLKDLTPEEVIKRLKDGEVVNGNNDWKYKMIDGILCAFWKKECYIGAMVDLYETSESYFETEEPFEIKETGLYKTRDGRKVFVSCIDYEFNAPVIGIVQGEDDTARWYLSRNFESNSKNSDFDIISKWED